MRDAPVTSPAVSLSLHRRIVFAGTGRAAGKLLHLRMREKPFSRCAQGKLIHKTNTQGASARGLGSGSHSHSVRDSVVGLLEPGAPLEACREWGCRGWRGGAVQRPAGSPATKSTSPQMSALGLRPLAPVYLLTSFFKISYKSLPWKHNGKHFLVGVGRKQTISFPCICVEFLNVPPERWSLGRHVPDGSHMDAVGAPHFFRLPDAPQLRPGCCCHPCLGTPTRSPARH